MKKILVYSFFILIPVFISAKQNIKIGLNSSLIYEDGKTYPVFGISISYYPKSYLFLEGSGEYIIKDNLKEFAFPLTINFLYSTTYFSPYAGAGLSYHYYSAENFSDNSLGFRIKAGIRVFDKSGSSIYLESSYDVPDFSENKGRWYFTGRVDKNFEFEF